MENKTKIKCQNCDMETELEDGYCEHCGYRMFGPRRNEVQPSKMETTNINKAKSEGKN